MNLTLPMIKIFVSLAAALVVGGCSLSREVPLADCDVARSDIVSRLNLRAFVDSAMVGICDNPEVWIRDPPIPLVVPDAVDIQTLEPGALGISIGELIRTNTVNSCKVLVRQLEASQRVRLNDNGLTILSRTLPAGPAKVLAGDMAIIGAYSLERTRLTLTLRRIRLEDSTIEAIRSTSVSWACKKPAIGRPTFRQEISSG